MDLVNDLFRVTVLPDGPDDGTVISTINGTGFVATSFSGAFHVDSGATVAPLAEAAPEPIRGALLRARDADKLVLVDFSAAAEKAAGLAPLKRLPTPGVTSRDEGSSEAETSPKRPREKAVVRTRSVLRVEGMT